MAGSRGWWSKSEVLTPNVGSVKNTPYVLVWRKNWFGIIIFGIIFVLVVASFFAAALSNPGREIRVTSDGKTVFPPELSALSASCLGVVKTPPVPPETVGWIPEPDISAPSVDEAEQPFWFSTPPVGGNFYPEPFFGTSSSIPYDGDVRAGEIPNFGQSVSLLYRGWIVVWYRASSVTENEVDAFISSIEANGTDLGNVLVAPWPYEGTVSWLSDKGWMYTAWGSWQKCSFPSVKVLTQFREVNPESEAPGYGVPLLQSGPQAELRNREFPESVLNMKAVD